MSKSLEPDEMNAEDEVIELRRNNADTLVIEESESIQYSSDTVSEWGIFSRFSRRSVMAFCAKFLAMGTPICAYSIYLVLPYYVISTPENGWGPTDLALFYSAISVGEIVGSQVVPFAAVLDSNNVLFIGHSLQILLAFFGFFCMSSMLFFNYWLFTAGMFSLGFSNGLSAIQAYCTEIADGDETFEVDLMSQLGQLNALSNLVSAFALPAIYDSFGFAAYCATMMAVCSVMMIAFCILIFRLKAQEREYQPSFHTFSGDDSSNDDKTEDESSNAMSSNMTSSKHVQLQNTTIPITSYLSPSMYMLLLLKVVQSFCIQVYCIAAPIVFAKDFGITSQIGGVLYGMAAIFGILGIFLNTKIGAFVKSWEYPYDISMYFAIVSVSCMSYVVFYQRWIAFSLHIMAMGSMFTLFGIEMTCRLFLCPSQVFQQITGIVGVLQAVTFLLGSIMAPKFFEVSDRFPFLVLAILSFVVSLGALFVFCWRQKVLNQNFSGIKGNRGYLAKERAFYAMVNQSSSRRGAILSDQQITLMDDIQDQLETLQQQFSTRRGLTFLMNPMAASRMEQFANNAAVIGEMRKSQMIRMEQKDKSGPFNPNALIQMDEIEEMDIALDDDEDQDQDPRLGNVGILDSIHEKIGHISQSVSEAQSARNSICEDKVTITSAATGMKSRSLRDPQLSFVGPAGPSQMHSPTRRSSLTMRKSIYQIAANQSPKRRKKNKGGGKMSIARASMFRRCEPAIALNGDTGGVSAEREAVRRAKSIAYSLQHSRKSVFMGGMGR